MLLKPFANRLTRATLAAAGTLATTLICSAAAQGGTVQIKSCGDAPAGGADTAWQIVNDNTAGYEAPTAVCPPTGAAVGTDLDHTQILGRSVWTKLSSGVSPDAGEKAEMRFTAPTGTTITAVNIKRDIGMRSDGYYVYGRTDAGQLTGETCGRPGGEYGCSVGGYGAGYTPFAGLNAAWIAWGFQCGANGFPGCGTGASLHLAWAHVYASTVTLTDDQVPTGVSAGGAITTTGWKRGTVAGTISGSDNLGVQRLRWYADGTLVSTSADRACDFSVAVPCSNASSVSYALNTAGLTDGSRNIQAAVVDPAGNETKGAAFAVQVDNTAPPAPTGLNVAGGGSSTAIDMTWSAPAADGGSPYVSALWQVCSGAICTNGTGSLTAASGNLPNATGTYTVKAWLVDEAGNADVNRSASTTVSYTAPAPPSGVGGGGGGGGGAAPSTPGTPEPGPTTPAPPTVPTTPTTQTTPTMPGQPSGPVEAPVKVTTAKVSRKTNKVLVRGSINRLATGRVTITYRAKVHGRWQTKTTRTQLKRGRFSASVRLTRALRTGKSRTLTISYPGSGQVQATKRTIRL